MRAPSGDVAHAGLIFYAMEHSFLVSSLDLSSFNLVRGSGTLGVTSLIIVFFFLFCFIYAFNFRNKF